MSPFTRSDTGDSGFTLIEVLCALTISCLALVYLMQSLAGSQRAAYHLQDQLNARLIAQSVLTEQRQSFVTPSGTKAGDEGKYHWELLALPADSLASMAPQGFTFYRLVVNVTWPPQGSLQLETVRLGK